MKNILISGLISLLMTSPVIAAENFQISNDSTIESINVAIPQEEAVSFDSLSEKLLFALESGKWKEAREVLNKVLTLPEVANDETFETEVRGLSLALDAAVKAKSPIVTQEMRDERFNRLVLVAFQMAETDLPPEKAKKLETYGYCLEYQLQFDMPE